MSARGLLTTDVDNWSSHPILAIPTVEVGTENDAAVHTIVANLIDTMNFHPTCVGLAAPQIGSNLRIAVVSDEATGTKPLVLINPAIVSASGKMNNKYEACMSIPGVTGTVGRRPSVVLSFLDDNGHLDTLDTADFLARVIQHEVDHLDGLLYPGRMRPGLRVITKDELRAKREAQSEESGPDRQ